MSKMHLMSKEQEKQISELPINEAMHFALENKFYEIAYKFIEQGASLTSYNKHGRNVLHQLAYMGSWRTISEILKNHPEKINVDIQNELGYTALHFAVISGSTIVAEYLLNNGANIDAQTLGLKLTPLHLAFKYQRKDIEQVLITRNANTKLLNVFGDAYNEIADGTYSQNNPAEVDEFGNNYLHLAVRANKIRALKALEFNKDVINFQTRSLKSTPLHIAAQCGRTEIAAILLEFGADQTLCDALNETPAQTAASYDNFEIFYMLDTKRVPPATNLEVQEYFQYINIEIASESAMKNEDQLSNFKPYKMSEAILNNEDTKEWVKKLPEIMEQAVASSKSSPTQRANSDTLRGNEIGRGRIESAKQAKQEETDGGHPKAKVGSPILTLLRKIGLDNKH